MYLEVIEFKIFMNVLFQYVCVHTCIHAGSNMQTYVHLCKSYIKIMILLMYYYQQNTSLWWGAFEAHRWWRSYW